MSKKEKLIERLCSHPTDFSFDETRRLLNYLGYVEDTKGKTSGSRVAFIHPQKQHIILIHKPHPKNILKHYVIDYLIDTLERNGDIK